MAGRKQKNTVDYFPHFVSTSGRTKRILRQKFGGDGVAAWWELLEILGRTDNHYYDASDELDWQDLFSQLYLDENTAKTFLNLLAKIDKIDRDLWEKKSIVWCNDLVANLSQVYAKRGRKLPLPPISVTEMRISVTEMRQSKVKKSKVKKKETILFPDSFQNEQFQSAFEGFRNHRKNIRKPLTTNAENLVIKELVSLAGESSEKAVAILEKSIMSGWTGVFPLNENGNGKKPTEITEDDLMKSLGRA